LKYIYFFSDGYTWTANFDLGDVNNLQIMKCDQTITNSCAHFVPFTPSYCVPAPMY